MEAISTARRMKYPGIQEAEQERIRSSKLNKPEDLPDFVGGAPNYDKYRGIPAEQVLVWLNID